MSNNIKEDTKDVSENRIYEIGYLFVPTIPEEEVAVSYSALKDQIVEFGGLTISDEMPTLIDLAYDMLKVHKNERSKFNKAYFGWVKFEIDPEKLEDLKKKLDAEAKVLRYLIIKTVRENTISSKKFLGRDIVRKKYTPRKEEKTVEKEIDKEAIDEEIDALVEETEEVKEVEK